MFKGSADLNLGSGAVTLGTSPQITIAGGNLTIGGVVGPVSGGYGLTKSGPGNLVLNAANTYNGNTTINAGTLVLGGGGIAGKQSQSYGQWHAGCFCRERICFGRQSGFVGFRISDR